MGETLLESCWLHIFQLIINLNMCTILEVNSYNPYNVWMCMVVFCLNIVLPWNTYVNVNLFYVIQQFQWIPRAINLPVVHVENTATILRCYLYSVPTPPIYRPFWRPIRPVSRPSCRTTHGPDNSTTQQKRKWIKYKIASEIYRTKVFVTISNRL